MLLLANHIEQDLSSFALIDLYCTSYATPPVAVTLDIDDTLDVVHGHQQLSLFNAHYDERCFLPIHVYDVATSRPLAVLLRPGKTPSGQEVTGHLRRLVRRIRRHWPTSRSTTRRRTWWRRSQSVWLSAIGHSLELQYEDALAAPIPAQLAGLLRQFDTHGEPG
jgi:hypothetical protein